MAISLIILLLMTIIGVSAMQSTTLQEKMAGNLRDSNIAFQAAESALRDAENSLFSTTTLPTFSSSCANGFCLPAAPNGTPQWKNVSYWNNDDKTRRYRRSINPDAETCTGSPTNSPDDECLPYVSKQPRTMIEELVIPPLDPSEPPTIRHRVTAQGYGASANNVVTDVRNDETIQNPHARAMLQTIVQR